MHPYTYTCPAAQPPAGPSGPTITPPAWLPGRSAADPHSHSCTCTLVYSDEWMEGGYLLEWAVDKLADR